VHKQKKRTKREPEKGEEQTENLEEADQGQTGLSTVLRAVLSAAAVIFFRGDQAAVTLRHLRGSIGA